jgi:hypothetical protein
MMNDPNTQQIFNDRPQQPLPNATLVLVLGIISIIACCCYGGGIILSVIALVLANKDQRLYFSAPGMYTPASYDNLKAGKICAIISLVMSALFIVAIIMAIGTVGWEAINNPEELRRILEANK